jgi:hypothetical protein
MRFGPSFALCPEPPQSCVCLLTLGRHLLLASSEDRRLKKRHAPETPAHTGEILDEFALSWPLRDILLHERRAQRLKFRGIFITDYKQARSQPMLP